MKVEINAMNSQEVNFQKSQKLLASRSWVILSNSVTVESKSKCF